MARTVRDSSLESRTARRSLAVQHDYYRRPLDPGLLLLYRKGTQGGVWAASFYIGDKKYRIERIGVADDKADADGLAVFNFTQAQAEARKRHAAATRTAAGLPEPSTGPYTVNKAMAAYFTHLENDGRSEKNVTDARRKAEAHILPRFGGERLNGLTTKQIRDWHHALAKAPPRLRGKVGKRQRHRAVDMTDSEVRRQRRSTANRLLGIFKAALNHAWRDHKTASDESWRRVQPFKGATASRARYLSRDEIGRLVNAADKDFREMIRAGLHTGCRYSELCRLKPADFNADAHTLAIHVSKSGKTRHVHLTDEGAAFFAAVVAKAGDRPHLFVRADGEALRTSWQIRLMKTTCARARIKPSIGFHGLRHTYASHAVMGHVPLLVVARNIGHRDERMISMHYGHLSPSFESDAIRKGALRFESEADDTVTPLHRSKSR